MQEKESLTLSDAQIVVERLNVSSAARSYLDSDPDGGGDADGGGDTDGGGDADGGDTGGDTDGSDPS